MLGVSNLLFAYTLYALADPGTATTGGADVIIRYGGE
jgi:hypothetical protein